MDNVGNPKYPKVSRRKVLEAIPIALARAEVEYIQKCIDIGRSYYTKIRQPGKLKSWIAKKRNKPLPEITCDDELALKTCSALAHAVAAMSFSEGLNCKEWEEYKSVKKTRESWKDSMEFLEAMLQHPEFNGEYVIISSAQFNFLFPNT